MHPKREGSGKPEPEATRKRQKQKALSPSTPVPLLQLHGGRGEPCYQLKGEGNRLVLVLGWVGWRYGLNCSLPQVYIPKPQCDGI